MMKEKIMVRMTTRDKERLQQAALERRLPLSSYCRFIMLSFMKDEV